MPLRGSFRACAILAFALSGSGENAGYADDLVIDDFSGPSYAPWVTDGDAFGHGPVNDAALLTHLEETAVEGHGVATSEIKGDGPTGTLTSTPFKIERPFISFLIGGGRWQHNTCLNLIVDGRVVKSATGSNSDKLAPITWSVSPWLGRVATLQAVDNASGQWGHIEAAHIIQTSNPATPAVAVGTLYDEKYRPQFHFSAREWTVDKLNPGPLEEGWMNDINGPLFYDGQYHLFAQRWNKCWLHAVSPDLIHWTELEPAFWEPVQASGTQSGTCVIDYGNTSGLSADPAHPAMVAFWSAIAPTQNICYSLDHGLTWKFYRRNPVLNHGTRDPKVFWHEPTKSWVMVLSDEPHVYRFFTSKNLLDWADPKSEVPHSYECPDFFPLPVDGDKNKENWVLVRGNGKYSLGEFDGVHFTERTRQLPGDSGPNFYACQTWENRRTSDGRRIQAAWMCGGHYPDMPFNQQMSFPRELSLRTTPDGIRLFREPVREIALLHNSENDWTNRKLKDGEALNVFPGGQLFHIQAEVEIPEGSTLTFHLCGTDLIATRKSMRCGASASVSASLTYLDILVDRSSIEAFANYGEASLSRCFLPTEEGLAITCSGGSAAVKSLKIFGLNSAWRPTSPTPFTAISH